MTEKEMWLKFTESNMEYKNKKYDAWCFGGGDKSADTLAKLVLDGIKTGTASAFDLYKLDNIELPLKNGLNIILDSKKNAICIIETSKVYNIPYNQVSKEHAFKEGEGDRSLEYWRAVHKEFFIKEMKNYNKSFSEEMLIVCEEFKVIFK